MCEGWLRHRERRREERFDEEIRYLLDEKGARPEPEVTLVAENSDEEPRDPERVRREATTRS